MIASSVAASGVMFAGCAEEDPEDPDPGVGDDDTDDTADDTDPDEDRMTFHLTQQVEPNHDYDPIIANDAYSTRMNWHIFDGLYEYGVGAELVPQLAAEPIETIDDTTYQVEIVDDATFHNGDPVTAEDVVHSFIAPVVEETDNVTSYDMIDVEETQALDETTVEFVLTEPYAPFATMTVGTAIVNKSARLDALGVSEDEWWDTDWSAEEERGENSPYNKENPIGCGPYEYVDHVDGEFTDLVRHEDYWGDEMPNVEEVRWVATEDDAARTSQILAGDTDAAKGIAPDDYEVVEDDEDVTLHTEVGLGYFYVAFNCQDGPTAEVDVRRGVEHAFDMTAFVEQAIGPAGVNLPAPVGDPVLEAWDLPVDEYAAMENEYDPERAAELIEPHIDGTWEPRLIAPPDDIRTQLMERIAARLGELDLDGAEIDPQVQRLDWGQFLDTYNTGDADDYAAYALGWTGGTDPDATLWALFHESSAGINHGHFWDEDPQFHENLRDAREITDFDQRRDLYDDVIRTILEEKIHLPGYVLLNSLAVRPEVEDAENAVHAQSSIAPRLISEGHNLSVHR